MLEKGENWELFGYDMRQLGRQWLAAWRDLLWGDDSPLRSRLDEVVRVRDASAVHFYQAGRRVEAVAESCEAILLPDDLVLAKTLSLPTAAESQLDTVIAIEVNANSPFSADDTACGWRVIGREPETMLVVMVIVSVSTVMTYLAREYDSHDTRAQEVWARTGGTEVVIRGFGESQRETRYRRRLVITTALAGLVALLLLVSAALSTGMKYLETQKVREMAATIQREAADASRMRASLAVANETITAVNDLVTAYPNPHFEIARLTHLLGDDTYLSQFTMEGRNISIRGRAADAAAVMQQLTDQADYQQVNSPKAITRLGDTGFEQFSLDIRLGEGRRE